MNENRQTLKECEQKTIIAKEWPKLVIFRTKAEAENISKRMRPKPYK